MVRTYSRQWVSNFKFDIPEFTGCMQPQEFLDWVVAVEETLEFKEVPLGKQVPLVATKFRGLAAAWWQYLKQTRVRQGKEKIRSWKKLKKHMCSVFLPRNFTWIKPKKSGNMQSHSGELDFKPISPYTESYVSSNFSNKIFSTSSSKSQISKELILKAEVGKSDHGYCNNIGDIKELEEELGEIFFSTDTCFLESQYDCDLPPKYDEYPDDEYQICELNTVEGVHVVIEETRTTTLPKENASEGSPLPINVVNVMDIPATSGIKFSQEKVEEEYANYCTLVEEPNIQQGPSFAFANGSCVFPDSNIPPIIRCDKPSVIKGFSFQDGKVTEDGNWVFCGGAWDDSSLVVAFYRNADKGLEMVLVAADLLAMGFETVLLVRHLGLLRGGAFYRWFSVVITARLGSSGFGTLLAHFHRLFSWVNSVLPNGSGAASVLVVVLLCRGGRRRHLVVFVGWVLSVGRVGQMRRRLG
ncbi:hypothetical protein RHGRI_023906 [Rhododendron griersonianum]|uniref:Retrotransposon gag domain-containing protein n=1 Tax=Rhododendron griersonianum TaxID=479676 RepID=A0AAV6J913_9ERIC|nr:hypothetical protein RHGRI_023906 [Rhododendron griersonianum]